MPVITDQFKTQVIQDILDDFNDSASNSYYAGIGRSEDWNDSDTPLVPFNTDRDVRNARLATQSVKLVTDASFVVPRSPWVSGLIYYAYDDNVTGYPENAPFYTMNTNQEIYVCLEQGKLASGAPRGSDQMPVGNTEGSAFRTSDGYTWKFLYSIGALRASKFLSASYMPVRLVGTTDSDSPAEDLQQKIVQNNAIAGQISGYKITNGGSGYTSVPTVTINGNGTQASAYAVLAGNSIVDIRVKEDSAGNAGASYFGRDYEYASVTITGNGDSAQARAIMGPSGGFGADPREDLRSPAVMFNSQPNGAEGGDFIIGNEIFRQVTLFRNLKDSASGTVLNTPSALGLNKIVHDGSGFTKSVVQKSQIQGVTSGAKGVIDDTNDSDSVWYHQNEDTGFKAFQSGENIQVVGNTDINGTITSLVVGEFDPLTGELLYIDNRSAVTRSTGQTEDLKIVISI